jgi:hypothetical protein
MDNLKEGEEEKKKTTTAALKRRSWTDERTREGGLLTGR